MDRISSNLLNGTKCLCDIYLDYRNECTKEIAQIRAEIDQDNVKYILSLRCRDTYDWDKSYYWVDLKIGEGQITETVIGRKYLFDDQGRYVAKFRLSDDKKQIDIELKQEFYTWSQFARKTSYGLYQRVPFTSLINTFVDRGEGFFIQLEPYKVKHTYNVTPKQYEMLAQLNAPLRNKKLKEDVKNILITEKTWRDSYYSAQEKDDEIMNQLTIKGAVEDVRLLKKRIEWLNGYYVNRLLEDNTDPIDVLMPTMGWHAMGIERRVVDLMNSHGRALGKQRIAEMARVPFEEAKEIWAKYKKNLKKIHDMRPYFSTNESMHWNP